MNVRKNRSILICGGFAVFVVAFFAVAAGKAQFQSTTPRPATNPTGTATSASKAEMDAEREQIWNSPQMLRARAWLADHISKSAKITPEEGKLYMTELQNMSPTQMKLWLVKFDHDEAMQQQQYSFWQQSQESLAHQAVSVHKATQQAYKNLNAEESASAQQEQGQLNEQAAERNERQMDNTYTPYGYGGYGGYPGYGYGGIHYHYHLPPFSY